MYRAFNIPDLKMPDSFQQLGKVITAVNSTNVKSALDAFIGNGGVLQGDKMLQHWFPKIKAEVFISHSHKDRQLAVGLAGWLRKQFGLMSFVDSCVWGHADSLLKQIDDSFCKSDDRKSYDYDKCKSSAGHVHMMLSSALSTMIDATECVIFLNTPRSITAPESVSKTASPWLFYELAMMRLIRRRSPGDHRPIVKIENFSQKAAAAANEITIHYEADLSALTKISVDQLNAWNGNWAKSIKSGCALDELYDLLPLS